VQQLIHCTQKRIPCQSSESFPRKKRASSWRRPDVTLYMEELRKHKGWVVAELAEGENKDLVKRVIRRAADNLHVDVEFGTSPPRTILFRT